MFLFTITQQELTIPFPNHSIEQHKINNQYITIITDKAVSHLIEEPQGFTLLETPSELNNQPILFSAIKYTKKNKKITIYKAPLAGRPIYYYTNKKGEFYCSTHITLLRQAGVIIQENTNALPEFFVYRMVMPPQTLYKDISQLSLGATAILHIKDTGCNITAIEMYTPPQENHSLTSPQKNTEKLYELLTKTIEPLREIKKKSTLLFSGGLDSSILSVICKETLNLKTTYSSGYPFEEPQLNYEKEYAITAAKALDLDHHYIQPTNAEYLQAFIESIAIAEEPLHHLQTPLFHYVYTQMPTTTQIVINGQGAGSYMGYFPYYLYIKDKPLIRFLAKPPITSLFRPILKYSKNGKKLINYAEKAQKIDTYLLDDVNHPIWSWMDYGSKEWAQQYFNTSPSQIHKTRTTYVNRIKHRSIYDIASLYSIFSDEDITLLLWSKIAEAHHKYLYFPFYDTNLLNYLYQIPWKTKLHPPRGKIKYDLARQCNLPSFITERKKIGLNIHTNTWADKNGIFEPIIPLASKIIEEKQLRNLQSNGTKKSTTFWNLINYAIWKRICILNEPVEDLLNELDK